MAPCRPAAFPVAGDGHYGRMALPSLDNVNERVRKSLWFVPLGMVAGAIGLFYLLLQLDEQTLPIPEILDFAGNANAARDVASAIAGAMMGFIGIVFSITILSLQLASSQFSPRALRGFLRDRVTKVSLGTYVAAFTYALLVMRNVEPNTPPNLTMTGLLLVTFASIIVFIWYINHIAHEIRLVNILETIAGETTSAVERTFPDGYDGAEPSSIGPDASRGIDVRHDGRGASLVGIDEEALCATAKDADGTVEMVLVHGSFVRHGAVVARLHAGSDDVDVERLRKKVARCFQFDVERTLQHDVAFGLRQLVDIALRALSPGINDPTTAVQAIDRIHDVLGRLVDRDWPDPWHRDGDGTPRVWMPLASWEDHVRLAFEEIRLVSGAQLQVLRRLEHVLDDLIACAPPHRSLPLERQRRALHLASEAELDRPEDVQASRVADPTGIG